MVCREILNTPEEKKDFNLIHLETPRIQRNFSENFFFFFY